MFCLLSTAVLAQTPAADKKHVTVNPDNIANLIKTLESETARTEFISNLKTLQEASGNEEAKPEEVNPAAVISEQIGLETQTKTFFTRYHEFLARNNLNATMVGKWLLTAGAVLIGFMLIFGMRWFSGFLRRKMTRFHGTFTGHYTRRFRWYARLIKWYGYYLIFTLFLYAIGVVWDFNDAQIFTHPLAGAIFMGLMNLVVVGLVAALIGEGINGALEYFINRAHNANAQRLRTLLPIIRTIIFAIFFILLFLVLLSELGIDIVPLLAGAGFLSVAIGIGAQKFLQDFLIGFTVIIEDLFHVGDVVSLAGKTGVVEVITLRKVQLRDYNGTVYTIPFSEVKVIDNLTKDFSFYQIDLGVAYREDTDEILDCMRTVDQSLRNDPDFKELILEPIDIAGVDRFGDSAVIVKARIKTKPIQQWNVGREFNRRIKKIFDERGIEIPFPYQTVVFGNEVRGHKNKPVDSVQHEKNMEKLYGKDHRQPQE